MSTNRYQALFERTSLKECIFIFIGSGFGLGLSPIAPGSCGALLGVAAHILIWSYLPSAIRLYALVFIFLLVCAVHFLLTPWAVAYWRSKDPGHFVLDEVAGYLLVIILYRHGNLWQIALWGFLLFRLFDIIKIPPARQIDRNMPGAWGILLDDFVSAGYAVLAMFILKWSEII